MIDIKYQIHNYKNHRIKILKEVSSFGKNSVTSYVWDIEDPKTKIWKSSWNNFQSSEVALKNAQFYIEEFLKEKK